MPAMKRTGFCSASYTGGQLTDPVLIITCDNLLGSDIAQGLMETDIFPPIHPVQCRPFDFVARSPSVGIDQFGLV